MNNDICTLLVKGKSSVVEYFPYKYVNFVAYCDGEIIDKCVMEDHLFYALSEEDRKRYVEDPVFTIKFYVNKQTMLMILGHSFKKEK